MLGVTESINSFVGSAARLPLCFVPIATEQPFAPGHLRRALADAPPEFARAGRVIQLNIVELRATVHKVHMGIVEPGKQPLPSRIHNARMRAVPCFNLLIRPDPYNSVSEDGHRLRFRAGQIDGPDMCMMNDQVGGGAGLTVNGHDATSGSKSK